MGHWGFPVPTRGFLAVVLSLFRRLWLDTLCLLQQWVTAMQARMFDIYLSIAGIFWFNKIWGFLLLFESVVLRKRHPLGARQWGQNVASHSGPRRDSFSLPLLFAIKKISSSAVSVRHKYMLQRLNSYLHGMMMGSDFFFFDVYAWCASQIRWKLAQV